VKRSIAIVAIIMVIIAAYVFLIMPLSEKRAGIKESLEAKYATLQKYEAFLKTAGKTETRFETVVKEIEGIEANALHDTNESLAFAKLQGYLQDFAEKSGIKIVSIKPLSMVKYKHYSGLPIQLEASGGIIQLGEFIKQIDTSKRLISIDRLSISAMNVQMSGELKIRMQVSGLMKI